MSTKTISVRLDAYERLKRAKRDRSESFSEVIMRAHWDAEPVTAAGYLRLVRERGPLYRTDELDRVAQLKENDRPPRDKWTPA
ncbi:MAG: antitoxin VapB family protein [Gemmatimonadetes bacterium]|nr:antitoxin VapB family protein [Gemmatimonadota bacterium]